MPTIDNPYSFDSPIGAALRGLQKQIMSGPNDAQRLYQAEAARKLRRENENVTALGDVFRNYGQPGFDRGMAMDLAVRGDYDPTKLSALERYGAANTFGANDPRTTNAFVGAGGAYSSSPAGFQQDQARQLYEFNNKPMTVGSDTGPIIVPQSQAYGRPAVEDLGKVKGDFARRAMNSPGGIATLNPSEQHFIGAAPGNQTPRMYMDPAGGRHVTYDGITDARSGQPLPPGGSIFSVQGTPNQAGLNSGVVSDLQKADIEMQKFDALLNHTRELAQASPSNFGVSGMVKGIAQDAAQVGQNLAEGLGYKGLQDAVESVKQQAVASGVDPNSLPGLFAFDPNLPSLQTAADLLAYQAASALAGQSGRSVSDRDIQMFKTIVGDPRDWTGNQQKYLAKLDEIGRILHGNKEVVNRNLRGGAPPPAAPAPSAASSAPVPPSTAPGAPPDPLGIR